MLLAPLTMIYVPLKLFFAQLNSCAILHATRQYDMTTTKAKRSASSRALFLIFLFILYILNTTSGVCKGFANATSLSYLIRFPNEKFTDYSFIAFNTDLLSIPIAIVFLICLAKRLHDLNRSAWLIIAIIILNYSFSFVGATIIQLAGKYNLLLLNTGLFIANIGFLLNFIIGILPTKLKDNRYVDFESTSNGTSNSSSLSHLPNGFFAAITAACAVVICVNVIYTAKMAQYIEHQETKLQEIKNQQLKEFSRMIEERARREFETSSQEAMRKFLNL